MENYRGSEIAVGIPPRNYDRAFEVMGSRANGWCLACAGGGHLGRWREHAGPPGVPGGHAAQGELRPLVLHGRALPRESRALIQKCRAKLL